jgi:hypothetical protein
LDFLENPTVNAHATILTHDYIGIHRGTADTLLGIFGQILSHPSSWRCVGNPKAEMEERATGASFFSPGSERTLCHVVPRCPQRQHFTVNLSSLAFYFLVMHEVGHLRNGHLDVLKNSGIRELTEINPSNEFTRDPLLRQTLEIDADAYAADKSIGFAIERIGIKADGGSPAVGAFHDAYADYERALRTLAFAVYVLFRIFGTRDYPAESIGTATHPLSWLRLRITFQVIGDLVARATNGLVRPEQFYDYAFESIVEAEESIAMISARPVDLHWVKAAFDPDGSQTSVAAHLAQITEKWAEIRPVLCLFRRGGTLAP